MCLHLQDIPDSRQTVMYIDCITQVIWECLLRHIHVHTSTTNPVCHGSVYIYLCAMEMVLYNIICSMVRILHPGKYVALGRIIYILAM